EAILVLNMVFFMINATMYDVYYDIFSLQQLQLIGEAVTVFQFEHLSISSIIVTVSVFLTYFLVNLLIYRLILKRTPKHHSYYPWALFTLISSWILVFGIFASDINTFKVYASEEESITTFRRSSLQKYGLYGYYFKEAEIIFFQEEAAPATTTETTITTTRDPDEITTASTTRSFRDPYNPNLTEPTPFTGLLEGKNIITIMIESGQPFGISEVLTPNLYNLTKTGLYFPNHYSENKTNVSEMIAIAGNYPSVNFLPGNYDYDLSFALPWILNEDYETSYFHDNVPSFYQRGELMPMLGFENTYLHEDLHPGQEIWTWDGDYTLDSVTIEKILPLMMSQDQPFYSFWATLSTHGPYNYGSVNKQLFEDLGYFEAIDNAEAEGLWTNILEDSTDDNIARIRHYQAAMMDLDVAIGRILEELEINGLLEDTLIVLYGDHNVYYHELYLEINKDTSIDYFNMEMYHTFFAVCNPLLREAYKEVNDTDSTDVMRFASPYNIVPTIVDLLGFEVSMAPYVGHSLFSDEMDVFYSHKLTGIFNDLLYTEDGDEVIYQRQLVSNDYLQSFRDACDKTIATIEFVNGLYTSGQTPKDQEED
ncbi:MAG: LTA synthase family protein, partial [Bacilli bacterium]|nr:LTA synthase family protein [Bacilli bacterium]